MIGRFPVFRRRPVEVDGQWMWEDDPDFDIEHHLRRVKLRGAGGVDELRDLRVRAVLRRTSPPVGRCGTWR